MLTALLGIEVNHRRAATEQTFPQVSLGVFEWLDDLPSKPQFQAAIVGIRVRVHGLTVFLSSASVNFSSSIQHCESNAPGVTVYLFGNQSGKAVTSRARSVRR